MKKVIAYGIVGSLISVIIYLLIVLLLGRLTVPIQIFVVYRLHRIIIPIVCGTVVGEAVVCFDSKN